MDTLYTFWDNSTHYKTESVHFWGLMNSATRCRIVKKSQKDVAVEEMYWSRLRASFIIVTIKHVSIEEILFKVE